MAFADYTIRSRIEVVEPYWYQVYISSQLWQLEHRT